MERGGTASTRLIHGEQDNRKRHLTEPWKNKHRSFGCARELIHGAKELRIPIGKRTMRHRGAESGKMRPTTLRKIHAGEVGIAFRSLERPKL